MKGTLHLLPNLLDESASLKDFLTNPLLEMIPKLDGLICESEKSGYRFLAKFSSKPKLPLVLLNEHTEADEIPTLLEPILNGETWGLISDAGLPCIADPGSNLVFLAHQKKLTVHAHPGPSSIFLSLMLSGLPSQKFAFHGYLPRKEEELRKNLKELETLSFKEGSTQTWIEAPYRSGKMLEMLKKCLRPTTFLSIAQNLTSPQERAETVPISIWKKKKIEKGPAVFLIYAKKL